MPLLCFQELNFEKENMSTEIKSTEFYTHNDETALEAKEKAQHIAFAPVVFQASRVLRESGILAAVDQSGESGIRIDDIVQKVNLPLYGVRVLLESGLSIGLVLYRDGKYFLTKTGHFILHDELTRTNMDFIHDVCYLGLFTLDKSVQTGKPEGLKVFGTWNTIYQALSQLPSHVQKSWFAFDHFYSDNAFPQALKEVFKNSPSNLLDIGGNTGKWAIACAGYNSKVEVSIMDLPGQLEMAKKKISEAGLQGRIHFHQANILDENQLFPKGFDAIWMSQFLDCFSEKEIISILKRCLGALSGEGRVYILEPFWDRQRFETASFCLQQTSLYFTTMANGNSQMYHSGTFLECVDQAGFEVEEEFDEIGLSHTLLKLRKKNSI